MMYLSLLRDLKMKAAVRKTLLAVTACLLLAATSASARELPKAAKLVPPQTILLVEISDFAQLKSQFEKTTLYRLYTDPAMAAFVANAKQKWQQEVQKLDSNNIFKGFFDAGLVPEGKVALALVDVPQADANKPPAVVITQWGQKIAEVKAAMNKVLEKNAELGGHKKPGEEFRGVSVETIVDEQGSEFSYCFANDCFIASVYPELLKFVVAHVQGAGSTTLLDAGDYSSTIGAVGPYHDIDIYVNLSHIISNALAKDASGRVKSTISNLGLDNVSALACAIGLARTPGNWYDGKAILKIDGAKKGICKALQADSAPLDAPRFIPASTYSATFLNLDIIRAVEELINILSSFSPQLAAPLYMPLMPPTPDGQPPVQLKSGIIDYLGSQIIVAQNADKPYSKDSAPAQTLVAIGVRDRASLEKNISQIYNAMVLPSNPEAMRELLGYTVYTVNLAGLPFMPRPGNRPMGAPAAPTQTPQVPKLAFTITDTHIVFGTEATVERAIRTLAKAEAKSLVSEPWFRAAKAALPSAVGLATVENRAVSMELLWWMVKQSPDSAAVPAGSSMAFSFAGGGLLDFDLLPEFDMVRKYFGVSVFYGISRPDGFFFEFKDINPGD